jgi:methanogenic corrinoid protein MtbC1
MSLRERGLSLDELHIELLEPTARYLGALWDEDKVDFVDVTIGLNRLQRLVHYFAGLDDVMPYDDKRRALIVAAPGEQHILGNTIVQRFLRAAGWYVCSAQAVQVDDLLRMVAQEWFGVIGISLSTEGQIGGLTELMVAIREASLNRSVGVMVGGPAFTHRPELALEVGADGTAVNAPAAVMLAKKLLVRSISPEG